MRRRPPATPVEIANHLAEVMGKKFAPHFDGKIDRKEVFGFARIGAAEALHHWNGQGHFEPFAVQRIRWAILREARQWVLRQPAPTSYCAQHALVATQGTADSVDETPDELTTAPRDLIEQSVLEYRLGLKLAAEEARDEAERAQDAGRASDRVRVRRAVASLPPPEDAIVKRHAYDEESFQEIGDAMGMCKSTVSDIFYRAVRRLMAQLDPPPPDEPAPPPPIPFRRTPSPPPA